MGKSLDYIKRRVSEGRTNFKDMSFNNASEVSPHQFLNFKNGNSLMVDLVDDANPDTDISVTVTYDPNAELGYFTTESSRHDGTMLFVAENIAACLKKILLCQTYDKTVGMPENPMKCHYHYTIGDIVVVNEFGRRFATDEKPWMQQRTTVMIPIAFSYKEK